MAREPVRGILTAPVALALLAGPALAAGDPASGKELASALCGRCHALGPTGSSPMAEAPPFRTLHERYPIESLAEGLAEGLVTGHPAMPEARLEPEAIADLLAFIESLARR
ncbi:MAG: hypothetical protein KatS3mg117_1479 [Geminicoccaceae bacterium]|nr:MAG: hypothetical protein KatS3mg117_1479 [Geminicoccaceae bacterium]